MLTYNLKMCIRRLICLKVLEAVHYSFILSFVCLNCLISNESLTCASPLLSLSACACLKYDCKCENIYAKRARAPRCALVRFLFYDAATCSENEKHLTHQSAELGGV